MKAVVNHQSKDKQIVFPLKKSYAILIQRTCQLVVPAV